MARTGSPLWAVASLLGFGLATPTLLAQTPAAAAEPTALQGVVAEEHTGRLIESARVMLVGTDLETRTGPDGVFTFPKVTVGRVHVRVRASGFPSVVEEVEVGAGLVFVPILLPSAAAVLDELRVTGTRRDDARRTPLAQTAADLVSIHLPDLVGGTVNVRRRVAPQRLGLRGRGSFGGDGEPTIVLDGAVLRDGSEVLRQIPAAQVKSIRVLKGPNAGFLYGSADGVIYVQTEGGPPPP